MSKKVLSLLTFSLLVVSCLSLSSSTKPNVLMISVDDMNDWVGFLSKFSNVKTPNMDKLAKLGTAFTNAHAPAPLCNPSRTSILSGRYPHNSGIYNNGQWWKPHYPNLVTIPMHFKNNSYYVAGGGKTFHHTSGFNPPNQWDEYFDLYFDDPWDRPRRTYPLMKRSRRRPSWHPLQSGKFYHEFDWGAIPKKNEQDYGDSRTIAWASSFLKNYNKSKPFFLSVGFFHPHLPFYAPQKYIDMYPLDSIQIPKVLENDLKDVPRIGKKFAAYYRKYYKSVKASNQMKSLIQSYLAAITYVDYQIGKLLQALKESKKDKNTIVILFSDHGWHFGEKNHLLKTTLWDRSTRVPFIIKVPSIEGGKVNSNPVNLVSIFKTLNELCGLPHLDKLDGKSLVPNLKDPNKKTAPVLISNEYNNFALVDNEYRYIRYKDGTEELYDHSNDKTEWHNLAGDPDYQDVIAKYKALLPKKTKRGIPSKNAYRFNYKKYIWKKRN